MNTIKPEVFMESRKFVVKQTGILAVGQTICVAAMVGIFALLGHYDQTVLLGGIFGGVLAIANFFFMAVGATLAADRAEKQDVKGGQALVQSSYMLRMVLLAVILFALVKSGLCNVIAVVLPLAFNRLIITISEFFRK